MANQFALGMTEQDQRDLRRRRAYYTNLPEGTLAPDVAKSAATGARSGLESVLGTGGDIAGLQQGVARWLGEKLGVDPEMLATAAKFSSPLSLLPSTENVGAATDQLFGRDPVTRHTPETEMGRNVAGGAEFLTGMVDPVPGPSMAGLVAPAARTAEAAVKKQAKQFALPGVGHNGGPPMTKKAADALARQQEGAALRRTISERGFGPGENRQPFINPGRDELAAIRAEHGSHGINRPEGVDDLFHGSDEAPPYVDASQTAHLFPAPGPRTREQKALERKKVPEGGSSPRMQAMLANPQVKAAIRAAAEKGRDVQSWYDTTPLEQLFVKEFGPEEGMRRFEDYIGMVAGTSTSNKIGSNIKVASNYYAQKYGGGRDPAELPYIRKDDMRKHGVESYEVPPEGYGSHVQQTHMHNVNNLAAGGDLSSFDNPKIAAFRENLLGNWEPTTVDKHAVRLAAMASQDPRWLTEQGQRALAGGASMEDLLKTPTNWLDVPGKVGAEYDAMEGMWTELAKEMGVSPAELQAMAWVGGGKETGLGSAPVTFMDAFQDRIRRTAIRDEIPPDQVLKLMLHGKLTLAQLEPAAGDDTGNMFA